jgi:von Willebrand factor type A domain
MFLSKSALRVVAAAVLTVIASSAVCLAAPPTKSTKEAARQSPRIQMAILLDTSGSMNGLINQARTQLWKIVNELATAKRDGKTPRLEVGLYEYGKSSIPKSQGYLRRIVPLTDDLDKVSEELFALKTNGGEEYCGMVIQAATSGLKWSASNGDLKMIFIAGNEPFSQGPVDYKVACAAAIKKGITVNTIHCGPKAVGVRTGWQHGAQLADGSFSNIDQNRQVAAVTTPFDAKLNKLSSRINSTYVAFGKKPERAARRQRQVRQDKLAAKAAPAAGAARAEFKGKAAYSASAWDLIDAIKAGKVKLEDVKTELLPKEMQKLTPAERKAYLKKKADERQKIREEIKSLSAKRKKYIADARKKEAEKSKATSLDEAVIKTIRTQATKKNFKFSKN